MSEILKDENGQEYVWQEVIVNNNIQLKQKIYLQSLPSQIRTQCDFIESIEKDIRKNFSTEELSDEIKSLKRPYKKREVTNQGKRYENIDFFQLVQECKLADTTEKREALAKKYDMDLLALRNKEMYYKKKIEEGTLTKDTFSQKKITIPDLATPDIATTDTYPKVMISKNEEGKLKATWTDESIAYLKENYGKISNKEIGIRLGLKEIAESQKMSVGKKITDKRDYLMRENKW